MGLREIMGAAFFFAAFFVGFLTIFFFVFFAITIPSFIRADKLHDSTVPSQLSFVKASAG
jgi:hypothetical protein